jgi:hypothetical protein
MKTKPAVVGFITVWMLSVLASAVFAGPIDSQSTATDDSKEAPPIEKSWCETPKPFELRVYVPGWLAGVSGDSSVKGVVNSADVSFDELLRHLTHVPIILGADLRYQRWEFFGDGIYEEIGASVSLPGLLFTTANLHMKTALIEAFVGYRVINCDKAALTLFTGVRYNYAGIHLGILDNGDARLPILRQLLGIPGRLNDEGSTDWFDPVVGARGRVKLWKAVTFYAEGDVGGFDANADSAYEIRRQGNTLVRAPASSSDWSYQIQGGLEFQLTRQIWSQIGWRYYKYDYASGGFSNKTALNGPVLQAGLNF